MGWKYCANFQFVRMEGADAEERLGSIWRSGASAEGEQRMSIHPSDLWRSWMRSDGGGKLDWVHPGYICNAMWSELS